MAEHQKWGEYLFEVKTMDEACISENAGVFIFAGSKKGFMSVAYSSYFIGETDSFQTLKSHPLWVMAKNMGATHVHILVVGEKDRKSRVEELIRIYDPVINNINKEHIVSSKPIEVTMSNECKADGSTLVMSNENKVEATMSNENKVEATMLNGDEISEQLAETHAKLELLYQYEKHYLGLIKDYKEEIKFANTLQEDLRRERSQFFTQTLKDVIQTMNIAEVDKTVSAQWIQELVASYTKSIDLSGDLAKTHVIEIISSITAETKREAKEAKLDSIGTKANVK